MQVATQTRRLSLLLVWIAAGCGGESNGGVESSPTQTSTQGGAVAGSPVVPPSTQRPPSPTCSAGVGGGQAAPVLPPPTPKPAPTMPAPTMPAPTMPAPTMPAPTMPAPTMPAPRMPGMGTCLQGSGNYEADGPYQVANIDVMLPAPLGTYTIFYPSNMEAECKHPIVAWGNGTGVTGSATYAAYHRRAASWGIVTIASHDDNAGEMKFLEGGLDYLLAQNNDAGSMFFGKLSDRAGVGGHSQGGFAATTATAHPNVQAEVCVQGGGFSVPSRVAFMCQTGVEDFVRSQCTSAYMGAQGPSFLLDHEMADHISTPTIGLSTSEAGQQYVRTSTAWYRCWLADDEAACAIFQGGASAPVCGDSMWATCSSRNL
jgi:hypothetical protein